VHRRLIGTPQAPIVEAGRTRGRAAARKDTVMPDDTVTTSWKRSTDEVPRSCCGGVPAAEPAPAGRSTDRNAEACRQAAKLATWEDEGGTTVPVE
jgi:hypothetical protein